MEQEHSRVTGDFVAGVLIAFILSHVLHSLIWAVLLYNILHK